MRARLGVPKLSPTRASVAVLATTAARRISNLCGVSRGRGFESHPLRQKADSLGSMILRTVEQVRRVFLIIAGFTLLLAGGFMLLTPRPGMPVIFVGLFFSPPDFVDAP